MADTTSSTAARGVDWSAAAWAGIISGAVFMMLEMVMVPVFMEGSPWGPPRMIAAIAMGQDVLPPPATFDFVILMAAILVHFILSVAFALVLAWIIYRWAMGPAVLAGAVYGLVLYLVNFYVLTAVFPWFANARNWVSIFAHVMFGVIAAWAYKVLEARRSGAVARRPVTGG